MHFCSYTCSPWRALRRPSASRRRSGMLISSADFFRAHRGADAGGCRARLQACAGRDRQQRPLWRRAFRRDIFHAPICAHRPADDGVVVIGIGDAYLRLPPCARLHPPSRRWRGSATPFLCPSIPGQAKRTKAFAALLSGSAASARSRHRRWRLRRGGCARAAPGDKPEIS